MIRKHENTDSWKAGFYAITVHVLLLGAMLISFNWKAAHPVMSVTEVELWDKLPTAKPVVQIPPKPEPKPIIEEKPEPKPIFEEKPVIPPKIEEPKPIEPKVDIALEKKKEIQKKEELKKKELEIKEKQEAEKKKNDALMAKLQQQAREEELREKKETQKQDEALKKLQEQLLSESSSSSEKQDNAASSAASASIIGEYTDKIKAKIRGNVNKTLCSDGNPELRFDIALLPTGELTSAPKLIKSSGSSACDAAVERAITASQPLPLPTDPAIYAKFRNLNLKFKPNE